jgi:hypothetical protein
MKFAAMLVTPMLVSADFGQLSEMWKNLTTSDF